MGSYLCRKSTNPRLLLSHNAVGFMGAENSMLRRVSDNRYLLDARGYACPYPQVFTLKAIKELESGSIMEVLVDNPASCDNVPAAVRKLGHEVLEVRQEGGYWRITVRKR